jgi:hypothetical protein
MGDIKMEKYKSFRDYLSKNRKLDPSGDITAFIAGTGYAFSSILNMVIQKHEIELTSFGLLGTAALFLLPAFIRFNDYINIKGLEKKERREERRKRLELKVDKYKI